MTALAKFLRRDARDRRLFWEALRGLAWAKLQVHLMPFRRLAPQLGRAQAETPPTVTPAERAIACDVSWAVQTAARYVPLGFVCLPQAIAAKRMLDRRGVANTLYLGVALEEKDPNDLLAHAWLRAGDKIVTGESEAARFRRLISFGSPA
jgi:hypothetical protein